MGHVRQRGRRVELTGGNEYIRGTERRPRNRMRGVRAALRRAKVARILYSRSKEDRVIDYKVVVRMKSEESRETAGIRRDRIKRLISWKWKRKLLKGRRILHDKDTEGLYILRKKRGKDCTEGCLDGGKGAGGELERLVEGKGKRNE